MMYDPRHLTDVAGLLIGDTASKILANHRGSVAGRNLKAIRLELRAADGDTDTLRQLHNRLLKTVGANPATAVAATLIREAAGFPDLDGFLLRRPTTVAARDTAAYARERRTVPDSDLDAYGRAARWATLVVSETLAADEALLPITVTYATWVAVSILEPTQQAWVELADHLKTLIPASLARAAYG